MYRDTIVAPLTPRGKSSVGIIRVSGFKARKVAILILGVVPQERYVFYTNFFDKKKKLLIEE